jgi:hypothetical protein
MKMIDLYKSGKEELKKIEMLKTSKKLSFKNIPVLKSVKLSFCRFIIYCFGTFFI